MELRVGNIFSEFADGLVLVTVGNKDKFNTMTIGWGTLGTLWSKPICNVYVKKNRYTHDFMDSNDYFTVSFFSEDYRTDMAILGTKSGRDLDKVSLSSLSPIKGDNYVYFKEAKYTLVLKKIYSHDFDIDRIPLECKEHYYKDEPPHTMYVGEVIEVIK